MRTPFIGLQVMVGGNSNRLLLTWKKWQQLLLPLNRSKKKLKTLMNICLASTQKITPETPGLETIGRRLPSVCTGIAVKKEPQVEQGL